MTRPSEDHLADLARLIAATEGEEIDCAEMLDRVAAYLKALRERSAITERLRQVAQHLRVCAECREEFEALIRAEGLDPATILQE